MKKQSGVHSNPDRHESVEKRGKRLYESPQLICYGRVETVTMATSKPIGATESTGGPVTRKNPGDFT